MNRKLIPATYILILALVAGSVAAASSKLAVPDYALASGNPVLPASPAGGGGGPVTNFTYQGRLTNSGTPVNGNHDFTFKLFDASSGGNQVGSTLTLNNQAVTNGVFTVVLDYGPNAFFGDERWLEIAVRASGVGSLTTLSPRQEITPAPFARSAPWFNTSGKPFGYSPLRSVGRINILDSTTSGTGLYTSVAIGIDGLPLISYASSGDLKVVHCEDLACTTRTISTLVDVDTLGISYTSITIGSDGLGIISYHDHNGNDLKVAHCDNVTCTSATINTVDSAGDVGMLSSITIREAGAPLISYYDDTNGDLKVASCSTATCSSATISTLDSTGDVGQFTSITLGADGLGRITYYDATNGNLKLASCGDSTCSAGSVILLTIASTNDVGKFPSITLGRDGLPIISYWDVTNGDLKVVHCNNDICTSRTTSTLDSIGSVGAYSAIAIGVDGLAYIAYLDGDNVNLKGAHCMNVVCTSATILTIDPNVGDVGYYASLTIGVDGMPFISHYQSDNGTQLRSIHCGSPTCVSAFRRR